MFFSFAFLSCNNNLEWNDDDNDDTFGDADGAMLGRLLVRNPSWR